MSIRISLFLPTSSFTPLSGLDLLPILFLSGFPRVDPPMMDWRSLFELIYLVSFLLESFLPVNVHSWRATFVGIQLIVAVGVIGVVDHGFFLLNPDRDIEKPGTHGQACWLPKHVVSGQR